MEVVTTDDTHGADHTLLLLLSVTYDHDIIQVGRSLLHLDIDGSLSFLHLTTLRLETNIREHELVAILHLDGITTIQVGNGTTLLTRNLDSSTNDRVARRLGEKTRDGMFACLLHLLCHRNLASCFTSHGSITHSQGRGKQQCTIFHFHDSFLLKFVVACNNLLPD